MAAAHETSFFRVLESTCELDRRFDRFHGVEAFDQSLVVVNCWLDASFK